MSKTTIRSLLLTEQMYKNSLELAKKGNYDAVICLGAVIKGSTPHFDFVLGEVSKGIAQVSLEPVNMCVACTFYNSRKKMKDK